MTRCQRYFLSAFFSLFVFHGIADAAQTSTSRDTSGTELLHVIAPGESLYGLIAMNYPERMNRWISVAEDIVELNPEAFPRGLDTPLRPGVVIKLVDYSSPLVANPVSTTPIPVSEEPVVEPAPDLPTTNSNDTGMTVTQAPDTPTPSANPVSIGNVTYALGRVLAINLHDQQRDLITGSTIYLGDAIITDEQATASLRMIDDAVYHIRSTSRLTFESYTYSPAGNRQGQSIITLIKGGFRAISGLIARHDPSAVTFNTPVATIGIRGTDFGLRICEQSDCASSDQEIQLAEGLYSGVLDGVVILTNNSGSLETNKGEFYRIADANNPPAPAPEAASLLFSSEELAGLGIEIVDIKPLGFWGWLKQRLFGN